MDAGLLSKENLGIPKEIESIESTADTTNNEQGLQESDNNTNLGADTQLKNSGEVKKI